MRILVTDDDRIACMTVKRMLEKLGHSVELASDGLVAQRVLGNGGLFDLVLSDWMMPGLDGIELTRWIRQSRGDGLKVVIMTGLESGEASQYALRCGADGRRRAIAAGNR